MIEENGKWRVTSDILKPIGIIIGISTVVFALVGTWSTANYRLDQTEKAISANKAQLMEIEKNRTVNVELLIRIDERLKRVEEILSKRTSSP